MFGKKLPYVVEIHYKFNGRLYGRDFVMGVSDSDARLQAIMNCTYHKKENLTFTAKKVQR